MLREYFPEIDQIKNDALKKKIADAWARGMQLGGWTREQLDKLPFTLLMDTGISFMKKTQAFVKMAFECGLLWIEYYGDVRPINMDYLIAGAILLDVGKLVEIEQDGEGGWRKSRSAKLIRHPVYGAMLCWECGVPEEVCHMVAFHSSEGDKHPRTPEGWILHHLDFLQFDPFKWQD